MADIGREPCASPGMRLQATRQFAARNAVLGLSPADVGQLCQSSPPHRLKTFTQGFAIRLIPAGAD